MKSSSLAERLEEYEAEIDSLKLAQEPVSRRVMPKEAQAAAENTRRPVRRTFRTRAIETRDQGLRLFRVS